MIPLIFLSVLATSPTHEALSQAFLRRDLGAMDRVLAASTSRTETHVFFDELATFVSCGALPEVQGLPVPRALLRLEQARWKRLSAQPGAHALFTWLEQPDTFRRAPLPEQLEAAPLQSWPADEEPWPDELPQVRARPFLCPFTSDSEDELAILESGLLDAARRLHPELAAELGLHRAVRLHQQGAHPEGRAAAAEVPIELLPVELTNHLRLALALGDEALLTAAAADGSLGPAADEHACSFLVSRRDYAEVVRRFAAAESPYLLHCVALSLAELGRADEALAVLDRYPAPVPEPVRSLALKLWAARATAAEVERIARLGDPTEVWWSLGTQALNHGKLEAARLAEVELAKLKGARARARAGALSLELAWVQRDRTRWNAAWRALVDEPRKMFRLPRERNERDRALLVTAQSILLRSNGEAKQWRSHLRELIRFGADQSRRQTQTDWNRLATVVNGASASVSVVGAVSLPDPLVLPPPAPLEVNWPEPISLLLVPAADGAWRRWPEPDEVKHVR